MWTLLADKNIRYTVEASLRLLAVPLAGYLCAKNVNLRSTVLVLGLVIYSALSSCICSLYGHHVLVVTYLSSDLFNVVPTRSNHLFIAAAA